jgi:hypothetical protein
MFGLQGIMRWKSRIEFVVTEFKIVFSDFPRVNEEETSNMSWQSMSSLRIVSAIIVKLARCINFYTRMF